MIDTADTQTVDLFPQTPKKRGRPSSGKAQSNADRQAAYRRRQIDGADRQAQLNLNVWLDAHVLYALDRLADHNNVSRKALLEQMIKAADQAITDKLDPYSPEWDSYYRVDK